jgi:hypothetical protein
MDKVVIGLRAQDFHESLKHTGPFAPKDIEYKKTLLIGKAATLAMHLRGSSRIDDKVQLDYAASSLGIGGLEVEAVLRELEELDFVAVTRVDGEIKRIDVKFPHLRSGYGDLGGRWEQLGPSEIERASIDTLHRLSETGPSLEDELVGKLGPSPVRYSIGRPIRYPRRIVETLRDQKRFGKGHPDLFTQYGLLVEKLLGQPVDEGGGRWNFRVHDTDENMKAFQIAIEMIEYGESPSAHINLAAQKALLAPAGYMGPVATRPVMAITINPSSSTRMEMIRQTAKLARGRGSHD